MRNRLIKGLAAGAIVAAMLLLPAAAHAGGTKLHADLTGNKETGKGAKNGLGVADVRLKPKRQQICFRLRYENIGMATSAGIFTGKKNQDGNTKVVFFNTPTDSPAVKCVHANKRVQSRIKRKPRNYHVNVETKKFPDGAIRGQLEKNR
jgi:hypothetical protein